MGRCTWVICKCCTILYVKLKYSWILLSSRGSGTNSLQLPKGNCIMYVCIPVLLVLQVYVWFLNYSAKDKCQWSGKQWCFCSLQPKNHKHILQFECIPSKSMQWTLDVIGLRVWELYLTLELRSRAFGKWLGFKSLEWDLQYKILMDL